ncbi:MAG TPA: NrfD/PsrC family molybdoenzyme membrane anchor subunit [Fibrobacteria bacterium]|nr:NrfD/PsrC family molybdoenzyme membrane anchor subunit [Fibrobacteria bacterium]
MILDRDNDPRLRPVLVETPDFHEVTDIISKPTESRIQLPWVILMLMSLSLLSLMFGLIGYLFWEGTGVWGVMVPVAWGWAIVNFVWWIGIGHAGTLISAILFLFRQKWRTAINRFSEAMTIFAVMCAGIFPVIHIGRVWLAYYLFPLPNQMGMWPQSRSPLFWDVFAISTYFTISVLFWFMGLIPDLATLRDRATTKVRKFVLALFALGWRGSARHWQNYERAYLILAAISTPLVLSVHSIVSFDFATSRVPGWHTTIFPPYFVAGAVFSGFALVSNLLIIARQIFGLKKVVRMHHLDNMNKFMLLTGSLVGYAYAMEIFIAWYSGNIYERYAFWNRALGEYWWSYWAMVSCNVIAPQFFWFRKVRFSIWATFILCIFINIGMWFERFVIVITLHADFLPSSWGYYRPTWVDIWTYIGTFGLFGTFFLLFLKYLPQLAIAEVKGVMPEADPHHAHNHGAHAPAGAHGGH